MPWLFSFKGKIRPLPYALWCLALFVSQHLLVAGVRRAFGQPLESDPWFLVIPLRSLSLRAIVIFDRSAGFIEILVLVYFLIVAWALSSLAFRRAADAGVSEWIAAYAFVPVIQIPVILFLSVIPSRRQAELAPEEVVSARPTWVPAAQGVIAGIGITLFAVAVGALVFRSYGFGMFVISPFVVGATTGYFANRHGEIDASRSVHLVLCATALGELRSSVLRSRVQCVLSWRLHSASWRPWPAERSGAASPCRRSARPPKPSRLLRSCRWSLRLRALSPQQQASTHPRTLWWKRHPSWFGGRSSRWRRGPGDWATYQLRRVFRNCRRRCTMDAPPALPFRLGVAYPLGGEIIGKGVGAVRRGEFSTGTAIEQVTEWIAQRKLTFVVLNDVPSMRELSPYQHVHAPHVVGYFRTTSTSFELLPQPGGQTQIVERTSHELKLDPVFYWLPLARWMVHENNARVLAHIRGQAGRSFRAGN
jgi:uncharacterized membrane protein YhaH (DUF805 family)